MNLEEQAQALYKEDGLRKQWNNRPMWQNLHAAARDWYRKLVQDSPRTEHAILPCICEHCE